MAARASSTVVMGTVIDSTITMIQLRSDRLSCTQLK